MSVVPPFLHHSYCCYSFCSHVILYQCSLCDSHRIASRSSAAQPLLCLILPFLSRVIYPTACAPLGAAAQESGRGRGHVRERRERLPQFLGRQSADFSDASPLFHPSCRRHVLPSCTYVCVCLCDASPVSLTQQTHTLSTFTCKVRTTDGEIRTRDLFMQIHHLLCSTNSFLCQRLTSCAHLSFSRAF